MAARIIMVHCFVISNTNAGQIINSSARMNAFEKLIWMLFQSPVSLLGM